MCPKAKTFWQSLFCLRNPENALVDLVNALAGADAVTCVPADLLDALSIKYNGDMYRKFRHRLDALYGDYLQYCFFDRVLSAEEIAQIKHLQKLLRITPAVHTSVYNKTAGSAYRKAVSAAIADGRLTDDERRALDEAALAMGLTDAARDAVNKDVIGRMIQGRYDEALSDRVLSPDEDRELNDLASALGVTITHDAATESHLNAYRMMWRVRFGDLPTFDPGINLQRGETCYMQRAVEWHEMRRQRVGVGYSGPTMRVKIAKGIYWRAGTLGVKPLTRDALVRIDSGTVFITNKRLLFMGTMKNVTVKLDRILDVTKYTDGVGIEKDSGKSPVLLFGAAIDLFCAILARAIDDNSSGR
jgi:tellurite resistance protein